MYVKDYMTKEVVSIQPSTSILSAQDLLEKHQFNRLPVMENKQLMGVVTKDIIGRNLPSNATSLSKNEVNYILEKITAKDIMDKNPLVTDPHSLLDQTASMMVEENKGSAIVMDNNLVVGIITDKDIFKAFIDISGSKSKGTTLVIELATDRAGVIEEIGDSLVETDNNLTHMTVYHLYDTRGIRIVLKVDTPQVDALSKNLASKGYEVKSIYQQ